MKPSNTDRISSIAPRCARTAAALRAATFALLLGAAGPLAAQTASGKFLQTFLLYYGGGPTLVASDAARLAKFDLLNFDRFRYNQIGPNTWASIKALNPNVSIYLYEDGPDVYNDQDALPQISLNTVGRYNVSRGHPMGSLNGDHPELFLLDSGGSRIYSLVYSNPAANHFNYLLDFGSAAYQSYWLTAVKADIIDQPWVADGVHADDCVSTAAELGDNAVPAKYSTAAAWSAGMNSFVGAIAAGLHGYGQKLWCNKGGTRLVDGSTSWLALDAGANPPDVFMEEGAFAVMWGPWSVQFFQESEWKRQLDTMVALKHTKAAMLSHTQLAVDQTGTDNYGHQVTFWQTLWYSLGSFLLGKNDALGTFFSFHGGDSDYNKIIWYDEYDKIDLGKALGSYTVTTIGGVNIYSREFEKGYVYVNPTPNNVASVTLPQASRQLTHGNLLSLLDSVPIVNTVSLNGFNAAILVKTVVAPVVDITAPSTPAGLSASAVSSSQINLSWSASTDNVGVTGYRVYRAGTLLATLGAVTAYQNTGLTPSTSFSYTVQALDAAGNASAQSAAASATTRAAPDTAAPSVPGGLTAVAASSSQINLSWSTSTDNVGVTGYRVFRAGTLLATLGAVTTYQNTGLAPSTSYPYTVQAIDAAGNASAQSAAASATTQAALDTTAPSVPGGLTAVAMSSSQINLSWSASTDNVGVTGYRVFRAGTLLATLGAVTTFQNAGLAPSTSYSYTVQALDAAGNASAQSASASAATQAAPDTAAPSVPGGLTAVAASPSQIKLSWSASTDNVGVAGYKVFRNGVQIATTGALTYTNTGLSPATTYSFAVAAFDAAGNSSAQSAAVSKRTLALRVARDFNGDGRSDILWRNSTTGENVIWLMNGATISSSVTFATVADLNWSIAGVGDFNGDGKADILWRNRATGENVIWLMNGAAIASAAMFATVADPNWSIAGVGDFNGDGKSDILWRHRATGQNAIWLMNGAAISSGASIAAVADLNWSIAGVGDFNGDGKSDILWRNSTTGENAVYFMNGAAISSAAGMNAMTDLNWSIAGIGDFDADGKSDVLWHNNVTGENIVWLMNGAALLSSGAVFATVADLNWSIAGVVDLDGDGKSDILWRNSVTGENTVWLMSGASISSGTPANAVQSSWSMVR